MATSFPENMRKSPARPRRIALVTETWLPEINGVAMSLSHMVNEMRRRGYVIQLIRPKQGREDSATFSGGFEEVLQPGFPIPRYDNLRFGFPVVGSLKRLWRHDPPDIVQVATEGPLGWAGLRAARSLDIPVITDFHTNFHNYSRHYGLPWLTRFIAAYLRKFHNQGLYTLVPSEGMRQELAAQGYRNLALIGRGVDASLFNPLRRSDALRRSWGLAEDDYAVIYVGRIAPEKNLDLVCQAYDAICRQNPRAKMIWVGDGPMRSSLQKRYPAHRFVGAKTGVDLAAHYASADIFLFPSMTETFGNVLLEAMASGLAVVAYRYAAASEYVTHLINGIAAPYGERMEFCDLAERLGSSPDLVKVLGRNARQSMEKNHWSHIADQFEELLSLAMKRGENAEWEARLLSIPD
ncbi:MAG: glycosyltransferase family 4 protein [Burkholderiales bacterium]